MKHTLLAIFISMSGILYSQNNCFEYEKVMKLKEGFGPNHLDSMFAADKIYLTNMKGCSFPQNELYQLNGEKFNISQLKGSLVFVNFWFASCHPCLEEASEIVRLSEKYSNKNVKFLNITFEQKKTLLDFLNEHEMPGVIQAYQDREILEKKFCAVFGFPMCFVLDKTGKVIEAWSGGSPKSEDFYQKVKKLIDENL